MNNNICIEKNVINKKEIQLITNYLTNTKALNDPSGYSPFLFYPITESNNQLFHVLNKSYNKCKDIIEKYFQCLVYDEGINSIVELEEGQSMPVHYDHNSAEKKSVGFKTGAGHPSRDISSVLYYNDDFDGGEIYFPNQDLLIKPEPGLFVCFPANDDFPHGVKEITNGYRWCSTTFWCIKKD